MTDFEVIKKSWQMAQELGLSVAETCRHMGVSDTSYAKWLKELNIPRQKSMDKVHRFIKRINDGETFEPEPERPPVNIPVENIENEEKRAMYDLIFRLEAENIRLADVSDEDPILELLRKEAGAI